MTTVKTWNYLALGSFALTSLSLSSEANQPIPFAQAKITQVVNDVSIIEKTSLQKGAATINQQFMAPDFLETGRRSRAELITEDGTITRVGSNTLFSFEPTKREIQLKQGSVLFHSPTGMGGGQIVTDAATAAVIGTTLIVAATSDGGFKVLCLEGSVRIKFANGSEQMLKAGQLTFVLPRKATASTGGSSASGDTNEEPSSGQATGQPGPVINFDLEKMTTNAGLLNDFEVDLPSTQKIVLETSSQKTRISGGELAETNVVVIGTSGESDLVIVDAATVEKAIEVSKQVEDIENDPDSLNTFRNDAFVTRALTRAITLKNTSDVPSANLLTNLTTITKKVDPLLGDATSPLGNQYVGIIAGNITFDTKSFNIGPLVTEENSGQFDIVASAGIRSLENVFYIYGTEDIDFLRVTTRGILFENADDEISVFLGHIGTNKTALALDFIGDGIFKIENASIANTFGPLELLVREGDLTLKNVTLQTSPFGETYFVGIDTSELDIDLPDYYSETNSYVDSAEYIPSPGQGIPTYETGSFEFETPYFMDSENPFINSPITNSDPADVTITASGIIDISDNSSIIANYSRVRIGELNDSPRSPTPEQIILENTSILANGLELIARNSIDVNSAYLTGLADIRMSAATVSLQNVAFADGAQVELQSDLGLLHVGEVKRIGLVNFLGNVTYANQPAENFVAAASLAEGTTHAFVRDAILISPLSNVSK
jgi:hypothetical protein